MVWVWTRLRGGKEKPLGKRMNNYVRDWLLKKIKIENYGTNPICTGNVPSHYFKSKSNLNPNPICTGNVPSDYFKSKSH
jgi:hypothetical protein